LNPYVTPSRYSNFDDRLFIETMFGSRYLVENKKDKYIPPYVYTLSKQTDNYFVYENQNNVGFDLWYTNTTTQQSYNKMNIAQKDALLLQSAVVDENIPRLSSNQIDDVTTEIPLNWTKATMHNVEYKNGILTAGKEASLNIPINNNNNNDGEMLFSLNIKPLNGQMIMLKVNGKSTIKQDENYPYIYPINQFTFRLDGNTKNLKIDISEGKYNITNEHVWFNSYKYYKDWVTQRNKYNLEDVYINGGEIKGTIKNNEKGILALNIPFSKGWSAKVDGKKQELIKVNGILTGLVLEPGVHHIELSYITPGLVLGAGISIVFLIGISIFYIFKRVKGKKN
jgi:uncharacterized membrane protein YfhO